MAGEAEGAAAFRCVRCGREDAERLDRPPFRNALGERVQREICTVCWGEWLEHQTLLINHYGLDPRERKAREFLYEQIEEVLLEGGKGMNPAGEGAPGGFPGEGGAPGRPPPEA